MWRPVFSCIRKIAMPSLKENMNMSKILYSTQRRFPKSTAKFTLVSASVGVLIGAGYGGYTHYKINYKRSQLPVEQDDYYAILKEAPEYTPHYRVINEADNSNLHLVLFQYRTCPFCCKVRAYLDSRGISYEIVEVDAVLRQAIKWSGYKKVPILLAKVDGGYQQLLDSTAIISILETYLTDRDISLKDIPKYYPVAKYMNETGKDASEISNRYFVMQNTAGSEQDRKVEIEEREWRQWADKVLVHVLSPNVYRTTGEALETFRWFEHVGGWREAFPAWECALMVYGGAAAMWIIAKRLKARHNIKDDVRQSLYDAGNHWMRAINKKGTRFMGGDLPNLADISVYGVLSSIEGCEAFQDLRAHTSIGRWYDDIKSTIEARRGKVAAVHHTTHQ